MGLVSILDTMLTFTFMIPAASAARRRHVLRLDFLAKQEAEEKRISPVAASPGIGSPLSELASVQRDDKRGKPILVSILGKVYDVGQGAGLYGVSGQYHKFAGKDITCACPAASDVSPAALLSQVAQPHQGRARPAGQVRGPLPYQVPPRGQGVRPGELRTVPGG